MPGSSIPLVDAEVLKVKVERKPTSNLHIYDVDAEKTKKGRKFPSHPVDASERSRERKPASGLNLYVDEEKTKKGQKFPSHLVEPSRERKPVEEQKKPRPVDPSAIGDRKLEAKKRGLFRVSYFKTEACRSWKQLGPCSFGESCKFAHDASELLPRSCHWKYKTTACNDFLDNGRCRYGQRCKFLHNEFRLQFSDNEYWLVDPEDDSVQIEILTENDHLRREELQNCYIEEIVENQNALPSEQPAMPTCPHAKPQSLKIK